MSSSGFISHKQVETNVCCEKKLSFVFVHISPGKEDPLHAGRLSLGNQSLLAPNAAGAFGNKVSQEKFLFFNPQKPPLLD